MFPKLAVFLLFVGLIFSQEYEHVDFEHVEEGNYHDFELLEEARKLEDKLIDTLDKEYVQNMTKLKNKFTKDVQKVLQDPYADKHYLTLKLEVQYDYDRKNLKKNYQELRDEFTHVNDKNNYGNNPEYYRYDVD